MPQAEEIKGSAVRPRMYPVMDGYAGGIGLPWWLKMSVKLVLARFPIAYSFWSQIGLFRHGNVTSDFDRLYGGFHEHIKAYEALIGGIPKICLELGPGDSIGRAMAAYAQGVQETWLVDVGDYAVRDSSHYRTFFSYLKAKHPALKPPSAFDRDAVLSFYNAEYKTYGLIDIESLQPHSIDLSFSNAVLEHIHRKDFKAHMKALYRAHKPGSLSRHWVDLHDHLGGNLNSLRFSERFWESALVKNSGFYTNRLLMKDMVRLAEEVGFLVDVEEIHYWPALPTCRRKMNKIFSSFKDEDLNVCTFLILLKKPQ